MKNNYTEIAIVLDRSGSMDAVKTDTIGGFNRFLKEQQDAPGECTLTLTQFDTAHDLLHVMEPIGRVAPLTDKTFQPRGWTALLDAIGRTIKEVGDRLKAMPEEGRPAKVIFVVLTDGLENASHEYSWEQVNEMITRQRDVYKWEFVFLGANQDAIATGSRMGVSTANTMTYASNAIGTQAAFASSSKNLVDMRSGRKANMAFTVEDREEQKKAGA